MREIIQVHIGQAGVQIGNACWELYCIEHGIQLDGSIQLALTDDLNNSNQKISIDQGSQNAGQFSVQQNLESDCNVFFSETSEGKYIPRAVLVDLDPTVIDQVRNGVYSQLFDQKSLISGKEDAACNFYRGYGSLGCQIIENILDQIYCISDDCESLQGFILTHAINGGTGSGLTSLILEHLTQDFQDLPIFSYCLFPSPNLSTDTVSPINTVLATPKLMEHTNATILFDNESIYNACTYQLNIQRPTYTNLNRLIAQVISSLTAPMRFEATLNQDMRSFITNLIAFPKLHFLIPSYAPLCPPVKAYHETLSVRKITDNAFDAINTFLSCTMAAGKFMACNLMYKGDVTVNDISQAVQCVKQKKSIRFADWCPTGFKCGVIQRKPTVGFGDLAKVIRSVTMISNNTAIQEPFGRVSFKYDLLYAKRAFMHWYLREQFEDQMFSLSRENLAQLEKDYEDAGENGNILHDEDDFMDD